MVIKKFKFFIYNKKNSNYLIRNTYFCNLTYRYFIYVIRQNKTNKLIK